MLSKLLSVMVFAFVIIHTDAFFFGGGGGGGGGGCSCAAAPVCPPPPTCPIAQTAPCIPQSGCGGGGYGGSDGKGGGSYASPPISYGPQSYAGAPKGSYASTGSQYIRTHQLPSNYASGPAIGAQPPPGYSNGPAAVVGPSIGSHSGGNSYSRGPVQVQPASYTGQAAGQRIQEVEDDLDEQMMAETKAEDVSNQEASSSSSSSATVADHVNLNNANGTLEVVEAIDISRLSLTNNTECNSEDLRKILLDNMDEDLNSSKRVIQLSAEAKFGGRFDVICSSNDFSYVTNTELYCQETKQQVSCYAYRQL